MFERDSVTGDLSSPTAFSVLSSAPGINGETAGFASVTGTNQLFVSMADTAESGGIVALTFEVCLGFRNMQLS